MSTRAQSLPLLTATLCIVGCGTPAPPAPPVALVELQSAVTRTMSESLSAYGTTEFAAADAADVAVQVESQVTALLVTSGSEVKAGQPLLRLAPSAATRLDYEKARRDAEVAVAERERQQRLRSAGLATEADLQSAVSAAASAVATRDSLEARVGPGEVRTLRAPRAGIVDTLTVQPGEVLAPGAIAVRVAAPDALQVRLGVEPKDAGRIAVGQQVRVAALTPGAPSVQAQVSGVDRRVDPLTRLIAALVRLPRGSGFLPGQALRAEIIVAQRSGTLAVPRAALLYSGEHPYLFVADHSKALRRDVTTGVRDGDEVEISAGLRPGEQVIVSGNSVLEHGMAIRTRESAVAQPPNVKGRTRQ
jgi:RND family efflux transporter MFP subunit